MEKLRGADRTGGGYFNILFVQTHAEKLMTIRSFQIQVETIVALFHLVQREDLRDFAANLVATDTSGGT
jgi:hypothetical protein